MKSIDRALPPTPESFHLAIESALRETEEIDMNKHKHTRLTRTALIAAILGIMLIGTSLAITASIGLWDFLKSDENRNLPASTMPDIDAPGVSAQSGDYKLSVVGAYYENNIANLLVSLERETPFEQNADIFWAPSVSFDELSDKGRYAYENEEVANGIMYYYFVCPLPDDAPDSLTARVHNSKIGDDLVFALTKKTTDNAQNVSVRPADAIMSGAGITINGVSASSSSLGVTLTLNYTFDFSAVTAPELPSCYIDYYTAGDGVYHTANCPLYSEGMRECAYSEIVAGVVVACDDDKCRFLPKDFAETYEPYPESVCIELVDANDLRLDEAKGTMIEAEIKEGEWETTFILNMSSIPDVVKLRAFDIYEKGRWADTVAIRLDGDGGASIIE